MTTESQEQGWSAAFGVGLTPRDFFAMAASEADILAHTEFVERDDRMDLRGLMRPTWTTKQRTREQARYAFADAMMVERGKT